MLVDLNLPLTQRAPERYIMQSYRHIPARKILSIALATVAVFAPSSLLAQKPYKVEQRWVIGGDGSWDYMTVASVAHRLYIAHQTSVQVVDLTSGKLAGAITGLIRCHGIVIPTGGKVGFISDGGANHIVVFDPGTLARLGTIPAGTNPDGIVYEPATRTLWAFNGANKNATIIDVETRAVVATIPLPGKPEFPVADGDGTVFVNMEDMNSVLRIDAKTHTITATWKLTGCESPSGLAIDKAGARLFSVCDGKRMAVTDAHSGKSLATPHIGDGPDATAFDARQNLAFSSNEDGTLTIIDASKPNYPVLQTVPTMPGARTMALDPETGKVYTVSARLGPPPASSAASKHPRPVAIPGTFTVLVIANN
jgi:DNA-binding beta-propeller fold protein YncE